MPDLQSNIEDFKSADTQVLGISVDSRFSHDNWASSLGGISFPLLADFHPKGAVAGLYGLYLEDNGITDRATVIIDKEGIVRFVESAGIPGLRKAGDLLSECRKVNG
jgi:alkyl hydroperoxide reductase subunit AhpC|tara:strand:+ start:2779 stop:3099 length:321 start_codon:yes stop_codon:yes gene_type:complete